MTPTQQEGRSSFHTDQGRWDRRDFIDDQWNRYHDDNVHRASLQGFPAEEYDEGLAMDYHEDDFQEPTGHIYSDYELEQVVKELLHNSKQLDSRDITVTAHNADIVLSGTVKSDDEKNAAGALAQLIHGVGLIRNDLIVKTNEGILPTDVGRDDEPRSYHAGEENHP